MAEHNVVRTDKLAGTTVGTFLVSARYYKDNTVAELDNGMAVAIGDLETGEREIHKATDVAANTPLGEVGLVASPEWLDDERKRNLTDFTNLAGDAMRVYVLHTGNVFGITEGCFANANPAVGQIVELAAGTKWNNVTTATANSTQIGKIVAKEIANGLTYYIVSVN